MREYYDALAQCKDRYKELLHTMIDDNDYWGWDIKAPSRKEVTTLLKFINEFEQGIVNRLPLMKLNRWLGYIQGTLISWGATTVEKERDWSRPLFKPLDFPEE